MTVFQFRCQSCLRIERVEATEARRALALSGWHLGLCPECRQQREDAREAAAARST